MITTGTSPGWRRALRQETRETVLWPAVRVLFAGWGVVGLLLLLIGVKPVAANDTPPTEDGAAMYVGPCRPADIREARHLIAWGTP